MQTPTKIISIDVETDGLWGNPFAIAAVVYEWRERQDRGIDGVRPAGFVRTESFEAKLPDSTVNNEWVQHNVLPSLRVSREVEVIDENWPHGFDSNGKVQYLSVWGGSPKTKKTVYDSWNSHEKYEDMLASFATFYNAHKDGTVLWHMGHVVEAFLFRECVRLGHIGEWDAPYTPIEVSMTLRDRGYDPSSVDAVMESLGLAKPTGSVHNPMYDCICAFIVWENIR